MMGKNFFGQPEIIAMLIVFGFLGVWWGLVFAYATSEDELEWDEAFKEADAKAKRESGTSLRIKSLRIKRSRK